MTWMRSAAATMPIFTPSGGMSVNTASICWARKAGGTGEDPRNPGGVLGGEGGDGAHGKDPVEGHGLQVGLDAGPAAGVAAGDGEGGFHSVSPSVMARERASSSRAAAEMSGAGKQGGDHRQPRDAGAPELPGVPGGDPPDGHHGEVHGGADGRQGLPGDPLGVGLGGGGEAGPPPPGSPPPAAWAARAWSRVLAVAPMRNPGPAWRRMSATGWSAWPTWTPSAPAARATGEVVVDRGRGTPYRWQRATASLASARKAAFVQILFPELDQGDAPLQGGFQLLDQGLPAGPLPVGDGRRAGAAWGQRTWAAASFSTGGDRPRGRGRS